MVPSNIHPSEPSFRKFEPAVKPLTPAVRRVLTADELRALQRRLSEPVECVYQPQFDSPDAQARLMGTSFHLGDSGGRLLGGDPNDDSGLDLFATGTGSAALTSEQEHRLFSKFNYCRYRVMQLCEQYRERRLSADAARELLSWEQAVSTTRDEIVRANVPLVLAMAKRTRISGVDFADLISEGNMALLRSVDKFDCDRGFKFSTYACRAILKSFARVASRSARYRGRFPVEFDPTLEKSDHLEQKRDAVEDDCVQALKTILGKNLANLNAVEERVIRARFALENGHPVEDGPRARTLEQVGEMIGVTKERVRQIQNKALGKLRIVLEDSILTG